MISKLQERLPDLQRESPTLSKRLKNLHLPSYLDPVNRLYFNPFWIPILHTATNPFFLVPISFFQASLPSQSRARIYIGLRSPRIDSASLYSLAGRKDNSICRTGSQGHKGWRNRFLSFLNVYKFWLSPLSPILPVQAI